MKKSEFSKNFPADVVVPPLLSDLLEYQNRVDEPYCGRFRLTDGGRDTALASFDGDVKAAAQFVLFGGDPDGSSYGYWLYEGRSLEDAPIVYLGSEGVGWTVLANSLDEFFSLLAVGEEEIGFAAPMLSEPEDIPENLLVFRRWLQQKWRIIKPNYPAVNIAKAVRRHPDLQDWLSAWQESRFGTEASDSTEETTKAAGERSTIHPKECSVGEELRCLLGKMLDEMAGSPFVSALDIDSKVRKAGGVELRAKRHCRIDTIFLNSEGHGGFREYKGALPGGILFTDSRTKVQRGLGKPTATGGGENVAFLGKIPKWDLYDYEPFSLHVEYKEGEKSILALTLMTPNAVPK
jgi:hypothetical protein